MKRLCTEEEKQLIYKNKKQMLKGIFQTASHNKIVPLMIGLAFSMIVTLGLFILLFVVFGIDLNISESKVRWFMLAVIFGSEAIFAKIINVFTVKNEVKKFINQQNVMINGATIVAVDSATKFAYVEDDVLDEQKRPIIIDYPSCAYDIMPEDTGKRIMILYSGESEIQLVKLNDELKGMIPESGAEDVLSQGLEQFTRVPHPNMLSIDKNGHTISEEEKEPLANWYVKMIQGPALRVMKSCMIVIAVSVIAICVLLSFGEDGYPLSKTLPIGLGSCVGLVVFYFLISLLGKKNIKRQAKFTYVKEVVFHSYIMERNVYTVKVYEWEQGRVQLCEYPAGNVQPKTPYGSILYKFINHKEKAILVNKEPAKKKK